MRAVTFGGGTLKMASVPRPELRSSTDAIVEITTSAICGSDLHIKHGRVPGMREQSVVGHEFVGRVVQAGCDVVGITEGDRVIGSCMIPCGTCFACRRLDFGRCPSHAVLGYGMYTGDLDGAQAEFVRVPYASLALKPVIGTASRMMDSTLLPLGDVLTTGLNVAREGQIKIGDTVVIHGLGPVGLYALQVAQLYSPSQVFAIDPVPSRRHQAEEFGAIALDPRANVQQTILDATAGVGADVALDCAGAIPALEQALSVVRPGGRVSVIGMYSEMEWSTALAVHFARGLEIKFCGTANIIGLWDEAIELLETGQVTTDLSMIRTIHLDDALDGYEAVEAGEALKVLLIP